MNKGGIVMKKIVLFFKQLLAGKKWERLENLLITEAKSTYKKDWFTVLLDAKKKAEKEAKERGYPDWVAIANQRREGVKNENLKKNAISPNPTVEQGSRAINEENSKEEESCKNKKSIEEVL